MAVLVDTRVHPPADRFDCWHEAASKIFFPLSVERTEHAPFFGRVTGHGLGPLRVFRIEGDANTCLRTPRGIAASVLDGLLLGSGDACIGTKCGKRWRSRRKPACWRT